MIKQDLKLLTDKFDAQNQVLTQLQTDNASLDRTIKKIVMDIGDNTNYVIRVKEEVKTTTDDLQ